MAALKTIAKDWADEIRGGIAWVIIWKTGRSWNAQAVWLDPDDDTFKPENLDMVRKVLEQDSNAVMLNGYYCGHFGEDMTVAELAAGIRWNYENGCNLLEDSSALPPEPMERPAELPADMPWYGKATGAEPDPYVYDGYMSVEDYEHMHELMAADQQAKNDQPPNVRKNQGRGDEIMKLNKEKFLKTEFGSNFEKCIAAWDDCLNNLRQPQDHYVYTRYRKAAHWCQAQWEVYQMAMKQFYGIEYHFTRTDEYYGVCTEDEKDWLFKRVR